MVQPLCKAVWRFFRKLNREIPYDSAVPLLGIYPDKTIIQKDTRTPMFIAALCTTAKKRKQLELCPLTDEWIKERYNMHSNTAQR